MAIMSNLTLKHLTFYYNFTSETIILSSWSRHSMIVSLFQASIVLLEWTLHLPNIITRVHLNIIIIVNIIHTILTKPLNFIPVSTVVTSQLLINISFLILTSTNILNLIPTTYLTTTMDTFD